MILKTHEHAYIPIDFTFNGGVRCFVHIAPAESEGNPESLVDLSEVAMNG